MNTQFIYFIRKKVLVNLLLRQFHKAGTLMQSDPPQQDEQQAIAWENFAKQGP